MNDKQDTSVQLLAKGIYQKSICYKINVFAHHDLVHADKVTRKSFTNKLPFNFHSLADYFMDSVFGEFVIQQPGNLDTQCRLFQTQQGRNIIKKTQLDLRTYKTNQTEVCRV